MSMDATLESYGREGIAFLMGLISVPEKDDRLPI
jgi:hypothetical protein